MESLLTLGMTNNHTIDQKRSMATTNGISLVFIFFSVIYGFASLLEEKMNEVVFSIGLTFIFVFCLLTNYQGKQLKASIALCFAPLGWIVLLSLLESFLPSFHLQSALVIVLMLQPVSLIVFSWYNTERWYIFLSLLITVSLITLRGLHSDDPLSSMIILWKPFSVGFCVLLGLIIFFQQRSQHFYEAVIQGKNHILGLRNFEYKIQLEKVLARQEDLIEKNAQLERQIALQAAMLKKMQDQITAFSNINAHQVRGPVSRILGLINLYPLDSEMKADFLVQRIEESALELDQVSRKLSNALAEFNWQYGINNPPES